ncbi:MAG: hypothetical protein K2I96_01990 [Lachnospiraceae bacterium]|nr:hypothetical protein [Lachnospiraceae bacterium]
MEYFIHKKMAGHKNRKTACTDNTLQRQKNRENNFYAMAGETRRYIPEQSGTDGALAYTRAGDSQKSVVQRKIKVGVSLRLRESEERPLEAYLIDTVKFAERADTKLKNYKSGGATQGAHTIADAFVKKYQKEMLKNCNVQEAYNFYGNQFQTIYNDNMAFLGLHNMLLQRDANLGRRIVSLRNLQGDRQDLATVTAAGCPPNAMNEQVALKVYQEELDRKERLDSSNKLIGRGQELIAGKCGPGTITQVRKNLVELISIYNEAYAQSALSTRKVGTSGRGEAGGMHNIKKLMSRRLGRQEDEDRRQMLPQFDSLLDRDSTQALEAYAEDLGNSIAGGDTGSTAFAVIDNGFCSLFSAVENNIRDGIYAYFDEEVRPRPKERETELEREMGILEAEMASAFSGGLLQSSWEVVKNNILQILSDKPYAEYIPDVTSILWEQFTIMAENHEFVQNVQNMPIWFARKRAGEIPKRFARMLYTLDDKYWSDHVERELDQYVRLSFETVDWITTETEKLRQFMYIVIRDAENKYQPSDVCDWGEANDLGIYRIMMQDKMAVALEQTAGSNPYVAQYLSYAREQLGTGGYIDQQLQDIFASVVSDMCNGNQGMNCEGWVLVIYSRPEIKEILHYKE